MNLAEVLLQALKDHGVSEIFGIPGDFALPFFKVAEESGILPLYTFSHEPTVGYAADGAARCHGKPSVAAVTYGAGGFNMVNPIAAAYAEKSPVIVISGGPGEGDKNTGLLVHHQAKSLNSQLEVYKEVTCDQVILNDVQTAPAEIARVLENCVRQSRPVYIEIPRDMVFHSCEPVTKNITPSLSLNEKALDACVDEIMQQIEGSHSPVLVVGVEIRRFGIEEQTAELAKRLGIPVVTTLMGRGLLSDKDVNMLGTYLGVAGDPDLTQLVENSDAPILLGVTLTDGNFGVSEKKFDFRKVILASDGQVSMGYHLYPEIPLEQLVKQLHQRAHAIEPEVRLIPTPSKYPTGLIADQTPVTPTDIATAINDLFSNQGPMPIAADMGDCFFTTLDIEYTDLVAPGFYATMGFGVPAGFGMQAATGRRPIVLVGDGAFQMTGWELLNAPRYGWNPIVVVLNNSSWELLRTFQPESKFNDLPVLNYANIANDLGGDGHQVTTRQELKAALDMAVENTDKFQLIEVIIGQGVLSNTLHQFVDGITRMRKQAEINGACS
ncbi:indolepyruvate/phenylpyruvate decarboxylase [Motiliproteus sp. MSK22-1]|uniref:indolepyruvate/phenylpyruvate decarboxylase n=1 Tax=Motiliproteus sp. MSK22-1 TaxID=1897630 RepID=UPI000977DF61|nr:indolepyruvate/phenylpyruvate decarboxylase [Motiliproteus sp. MSK22-1]OMH39762.1 indolepyruvate/phenylpyruvate decarboxylase [Motiliproteus sp. MSK22-1]